MNKHLAERIYTLFSICIVRGVHVVTLAQIYIYEITK